MSNSPQVVCSNCGASNDPSSRFCLTCGSALPVPNTGQLAPQSPPTTPLQYPPAQAAPGQPDPYGYRPAAGSSPTGQMGQPPNPYQAAPSPAPNPYDAAPPAARLPEAPYQYPGQAPAPGYGPAVGQPPAARRGLALPIAVLALGLVGALCVVVAAAVLIFTPVARNLVTPATATPIEASDILTAAADRMAEVKTVHYHMVGEFSNIGAAGRTTLNLEGDIRFPDAYSMHGDVGDIIVIGPDAWVRESGSQRWLQGDANQAGSAGTNPAALARFIRYNRSAILESDEMSGTLRLYRLTFGIDTLALAAGEGRDSAGEALLGTDADADAVVTEDNLLRQLTLRISGSENAAAQIHIEFSNFDEPVTVEPPQ